MTVTPTQNLVVLREDILGAEFPLQTVHPFKPIGLCGSVADTEAVDSAGWPPSLPGGSLKNRPSFCSGWKPARICKANPQFQSSRSSAFPFHQLNS